MDENALLAWLLPQLTCNDRVAIPPGDDCAGIWLPDGRIQLVTTDALVAGVHFESCTATTPELAARKLVCRNLSDIAAMAGTATDAVVTVGLPADCDEAWARPFLLKIATCCRDQGVNLVGGDMTSTPVVSASMTLHGEVAAEHVVRRSGAKPGDVLCVTGLLGNSFHSQWHLQFQPRLRAGAWLGRFGISAMMDLSDGLSADLPRLCTASACGAEVWPERLPVRPGANPESACTDGEDYELLLAVEAVRWQKLRRVWPFELALTEIGRCTEREEIVGLPEGGYCHYRR